MEFIFPPSNTIALDFSNALTYTIGQRLTVYWTKSPSGVAASLLLWQANRETGVLVGTQEYVLQSVVNRTNHDWTIATQFNLTWSNLFQLTIYQEGGLEPDDFSQYFYLESKSNSESASTLSASSSSSASSTSPASSSASAIPSSTPTSTPTIVPIPVPSPAPHANGFPISAKIGVGVGIPVALILGLIVGFLLFRRHKKNVAPPQTPGTQVVEQYKYGHDSHHFNNNASYSAPPLNEAPPESLVELDPQHRAGVYVHKTPNDEAASARYEM